MELALVTRGEDIYVLVCRIGQNAPRNNSKTHNTADLPGHDLGGSLR